jgi:hypothetical protein
MGSLFQADQFLLMEWSDHQIEARLAVIAQAAGILNGFRCGRVSM